LAEGNSGSADMTFASLREGMGGSAGPAGNRLQLTCQPYRINCTLSDIMKEHFALYENAPRTIKETASAGKPKPGNRGC